MQVLDLVFAPFGQLLKPLDTGTVKGSAGRPGQL
jgi:hypothetical protein